MIAYIKAKQAEVKQLALDSARAPTVQQRDQLLEKVVLIEELIEMAEAIDFQLNHLLVPPKGKKSKTSTTEGDAQ